MLNLSNYIVGTCPHMCPIKETKMRENQRLLHIFEVVPGTERDELPKADLNRVVKSFSRSAAGKNLTDPEILRPVSILLETVNYLLDDIINNESDWLLKYNFIMDRLRSVRQDMVIQNISRAHQIVILQPIIRFHAYAAYRSCEEHINEFDPHINNIHLQECLKRLLCMYDYYDHLEITTKSNSGFSSDFLEENRPYFETLYLIFNIGDVDAINRTLSIPKHWRTDLLVTGLKMSLSYVAGNYFKVCKLLQTMPLTIQMIMYLHMPKLRRLCLKTMDVAYNSKNLSYPKIILTKLLLYNSEDELESDCKHYGLKFNEEGICFLKDFQQDAKKVKSRRSSEIDKILLDLDLSTLLLFGDI
ncbi:unnamed protein product [Psylliodes chrysocephalus]|uniref:SAC3/GANP/THP3 conserved domain-containing protein n=1 Tax=Psylliodes chrysocephalus TaxID=3402493 RepID=A0A9P0D4A0_9CUCU|nr:unnamed protein product [Psylliodes chrysocephala]